MLGVTGYIIYCWYKIGLIWVYFMWLGIELFLFVGVTWCLNKTHYLHFHHYTIAMCIVPLLGISGPFFSILAGFNNGVMVEGAARWGYDPIWNRRKQNDNC